MSEEVLSFDLQRRSRLPERGIVEVQALWVNGKVRSMCTHRSTPKRPTKTTGQTIQVKKSRVSVGERYYKLDAEENKDERRSPSPDMHQTPSHIHIEEKRQYPP
jgi:hypothetical protein